MGGIIEVIQEAAGYRKGEFSDMFANAFGMLVVFPITKCFEKKESK